MTGAAAASAGAGSRRYEPGRVGEVGGGGDHHLQRLPLQARPVRREERRPGPRHRRRSTVDAGAEEDGVVREQAPEGGGIVVRHGARQGTVRRGHLVARLRGGVGRRRDGLERGIDCGRGRGAPGGPDRGGRGGREAGRRRSRHATGGAPARRRPAPGGTAPQRGGAARGRGSSQRVIRRARRRVARRVADSGSDRSAPVCRVAAAGAAEGRLQPHRCRLVRRRWPKSC